MFLKRIAMCGFKSFADKVDFEFAPGVTCIVGPNGCGKSNVVDAFKWVLGEQSAKSLRGRQMMDMIFNGSAARKSSGMSVVDLVFDNQDRTLPVDFDEVTISRKLYRSGESEYFICKEPSRLRDVRELFMDTGVGTNAYAVIEQGKVDSLLQSSPVDRRIIFEEAAGISKYKARRREAERKLERTQQNLLRVADIIEEVEKRLRSVKLQAGKARNFQQYDARLRELRAGFSLAEYHRLTESIRAQQASIDEENSRVAELRAGIDRNEAESATLLNDSDHLAGRIAETDQRLLTVKSDATAHEERSTAARQRIDEQRSNLSRAQARADQEQQRHREQTDRLNEVQHHAHALQHDTHQQNERIQTLSAAEQELARRITQTQAALEDEKSGVVDLLRRTAQLHNEVISLTRHSESLSSQKDRLSERGAVIAGELSSLVERKNLLESKLREVDELLAAENDRLTEKKAAAGQNDAEHARLSEALAAEKEMRGGLRSRRQVLADLQHRMEGVGAGARAILDRKRQEAGGGAFAAVLGLVADVFETDVVRARIVEAAIGEHDQHLVVDDSRAFFEAMSALGELPERTTLICLDRLPPVMNARDFSDQPGFVACAQSFVRYPNALEILARNLLGKTIVVDTLHNALAMAAMDAAQHRFVTLRGEIIEPDGRIRIGPSHSRAGLISRISELRSIDEQLETVERRIESLAAELNRSSAQAGHLEQIQQELRSAIYELHTARVETNAAIENIGEAIRRLAAEKPLIAGEVATLEQEMAEAAARTTANQASLSRLEADSETRQVQIACYQNRLADMTDQRRVLADELTEARVAAGQLAEKRAAAAETIGALRRAIRASEEGVAGATAEANDCLARIGESETAIEQCARKLLELKAAAEEIEAEGRALRHRREELRARMEELAAETRRRRSDLEAVERRLHEHQMVFHEAGVRRDELVSRVNDELRIDLAAMYDSYDHNEQNWADVENEIRELKLKIERLGNINMDAIAEQTELEERFAFLTAQRDDLDESRRQLDGLIAELNAESRERFIETFEAIRENFRELFRKLFGGGKADIILENPEDVLESGIEIMARPPGKELQSITLMSGGEKSMTAIALLMSIFRSRPSPFAILDEVDAALDEANNGRYNEIIREFLDKSQFIVITHSKRTMTIADQMYGITMQEPGVSTRVGVKFDSADQSAVA